MAHEPLQWGLQPPEDTEVAWGCRAIFHPPDVVDLVWNRQSSRGDTEEAKKLVEWINEDGIRLLRAMLNEESLGTGSNRQVRFSANGYTMEASPRASYGYLYLVVYPGEIEDED